MCCLGTFLKIFVVDELNMTLVDKGERELIFEIMIIGHSNGRALIVGKDQLLPNPTIEMRSNEAMKSQQITDSGSRLISIKE